MKTLSVKEMVHVSDAGNFPDKSTGGRLDKNNNCSRNRTKGGYISAGKNYVVSCNERIIVGMNEGVAGGAIAGGCFSVRNASSSGNDNSQNSNAGNNMGGQFHR